MHYFEPDPNRHEIQKNSRFFVLVGDFVGFGNSVNSYWSQKKTIAPGCEPQIVKSLMERMIPFVQGQSLAGAGGKAIL